MRGKRATQSCFCGMLFDSKGRCSCTPEMLRRYRARISGPLLDRIDLHLEVPSLGVDEIVADKFEESSEKIRERVCVARAIQQERFRGDVGLYCNAQMATREIRRHCSLSESCANLLRSAVESLGLSARAYDRILKVARTLADLEGVNSLSERHVAEAIHYRSLDRKFGRTIG